MAGKIKISIDNDKNLFIYKVDEGFIAEGNTIIEQLNFYPNLLLFSVFNEKQFKPSAKVEKTEINPGEKILVELQYKKNRIFRIQLFSSSNDEIYKRIICSEKNLIEIPVAYNENPGFYSLVITDVITGLKEILKIKIMNGK